MSESDRPEKSRPTSKSRQAAEKSAAERAVVKTVSADAMAVLPLRDIVVFPHMIVPLFVGREKSSGPWKRA